MDGAASVHVDADDLLERELELEALAGALKATRRGKGTLVIVEAPAGLGKSRLLAVTGEQARTEGLRVLAARGSELERDSSFGVALQLLGPAVTGASPSERDRLLSGLAGLAGRLFEEGPPSARRAEDPGGLVEGLYWLIRNLSDTDPEGRQPAPILLSLDDAHWADHASLRFLARVAVRLEDLPVAIVVAARPPAHAAAEGPLAALRGHAQARVLRPAPLSEAAVERLVRAAFPNAEQSFVDACVEMSGGNPFLLGALLRSLRGAATGAGDEDAELVRETVPDAVLQTVVTRLGTMPAAAKALAAAVAVLGDATPLRQAAALAELEPDEAERAADLLADAGFLRAGEPVAFRHALIASAVAAAQPAFARARAHRRAAALLAAEGAPPSRLAPHLLAATSAGDAWVVARLRDAAAHAMTLGDPGAAADLLERALAEPPPPDQRAAVLLDLALAAAGHGAPSAEARLEEARQQVHGPHERARADASLTRLLFARGDFAAAAAAAERGLAELGPDDPLADELRADRLLAAALDPTRRQEARDRIAEVADEARAGRPTEEPALAAHVALHLASRGGPTATVRSLASSALAQDPLVAPAGQGTAFAYVAGALIAVDALEAAEVAAGAALDAARRRGSVPAAASALQWRALARLHRGALADARADAGVALEAAQHGWRSGAGIAAGVLARAELERGEVEAARAAVAAARDAPPDQPYLLHASGLLALADGRPEAAWADFRRIGEILVGGFGVVNPGVVPWRSAAAIAALALGDQAHARRLAEEELSLARRFGIPRALGVALMTAGRVAGGERGTRLLREAVEVLEQSAAALEHARALLELGAALRGLGRREEAGQALRRALDVAHAIGAPSLAARARKELLAIGARPRRAALSGVEALTPAELRTAQLAAQGLTNREIAATLVVTVRTVEWHLAHAYRKLGVSARTELAAALTATVPEDRKTP